MCLGTAFSMEFVVGGLQLCGAHRTPFRAAIATFNTAILCRDEWLLKITI
jgi:hypothetical protein